MASEKVKTLSDLPDDILSHMLSFLPTQDAIKTSVLSTRWQYLFLSVPVMDFDDEMIPLGEISSFISSVSRMLCRRKVSTKLFKFCFTYKQRRRVSVISNLIRDAFDCDIQELDISCSALARCAPNFAFASEVFLSRTLVILRLCAVSINVSKLVSFPNIKDMELNFVEFFGDDASLDKFFVGLKSLDYLMMNYCSMNRASGTFNLSLPSLTQLNLYDPQCRRVIFYTPKLENLTFLLNNGDPIDVVLKKDLQCLVKSELRVVDDAAYSSGLGAFFNAMHNVKTLSLHSCLFHENNIHPPTFTNLTHMYLTLHNWESLMEMLHAAPFLKSLGIYLDEYRMISQFVMPKNIPICLTRSLSTIDVIDFYFEEMIFHMVGYLLLHGEVLERVKFGFRYGEQVSESRWESLLMLPRCARTCEILHR